MSRYEPIGQAIHTLQKASRAIIFFCYMLKLYFKLMYVLQLLNYVRPYGNQSNEDATDVTLGTKVGEEKFLERLVESAYFLDLSVLEKQC